MVKFRQEWGKYSVREGTAPPHRSGGAASPLFALPADVLFLVQHAVGPVGHGGDFLDGLEAGNCEVQIILGVTCGDLSPDPCLALRYYRICEAGYINALLQHSVSELCSYLGIIEHYGYDGMISGKQIEAHLLHLSSEVCSVLMNLVS